VISKGDGDRDDWPTICTVFSAKGAVATSLPSSNTSRIVPWTGVLGPHESAGNRRTAEYLETDTRLEVCALAAIYGTRALNSCCPCQDWTRTS
jgi:hypothetical protein